MANIQSPAIGLGPPPPTSNDVVIDCKDEWTCCQREQAAAKATAMRKELPAAKPIRSSAEMDGLAKAKERACRNAKNKFKKLTPKEKAAEAMRRGSPKCLADQVESGAVQMSDLDYDHPLDVKLGGLASARLTPLDASVNRSFGGLAKSKGDKIGAGQKVSDISLNCPPSTPGCPSANHSVPKPAA